MLNLMRNWEAASKSGVTGRPGEANGCALQSYLTSPDGL